MGFKTKKFANYVRGDRLNRVQAYVDKYGSKIIKLPLDHKGRNALHLACHHASIYCFGHFLKHGPNLMKTDNDGNVSLHWALAAAKEGKRYAYTDIVVPLLRLCPASADVANKVGRTPKAIFSELGLPIEDYCERRGSFSPSETSTDEDDYVDDDEIAIHAWEAKLRCEMQDEYDEAWGQYEQDYFDEYDCPLPESYEAWTNRMSDEYCKKHNYNRRYAENNNNNKSKESPKVGWTSTDQQHFEKQERMEDDYILKRKNCDARYNRLQQKLQFVMKCSRIFQAKTNLVVRLKDLPWMEFTTSTEELLAILLADVDPADHSAVKKCLREQQVHWHPDKFMQKCGSRLADSERSDVIAAVNQFSQIINGALNNIACT